MFSRILAMRSGLSLLVTALNKKMLLPRPGLGKAVEDGWMDEIGECGYNRRTVISVETMKKKKMVDQHTVDTHYIKQIPIT